MVLAAILAVATLVSVIVLLLRKRNAGKIPRHHDRVERLLQTEVLLSAFVGGITTVTYFKSPNAEKLEETIGFLSKRVEKIIENNSWVTGRIVKKDGVLYTSFPTKYDRAVEPMSKYFNVVSSSCLTHKSSFDEVSTKLRKYFVGKISFGSEEPLYRVTVVKMKGDEWGLVVSLSHVIGDGCTFYNLYRMFDPASSVKALDPTRKHVFDEEDISSSFMNEAGKAWTTSGYMFVGTVVAVIVKFILQRVLRKKVPIDGGMFSIDKGYISREKNKHCQGRNFVSTNDIITSWWLKNYRSNARGKENIRMKDAVGSMAINFRGKDKRIGGDLAGNYISLVQYMCGDSVSPHDIRASLATFKGCGSSRSKVPTLAQSCGNPWLLVTNWSAFYKKFVFENGTEELLHMPLLPSSREVGAGNICIVFGNGDDTCVFATRGVLESPSKSFEEYPIINRRIVDME